MLGSAIVAVAVKALIRADGTSGDETVITGEPPERLTLTVVAPNVADVNDRPWPGVIVAVSDSGAGAALPKTSVLSLAG